MIGEIIGQEISVNVPKNMKAQVIPQGNSKQASREGYNLYDYIDKVVTSRNDLTITVDKEDGYVTINGTANANYISIITQMDITDILEDGQKYTIWQEYKPATTNDAYYLQVNVIPIDGGQTQYISAGSSTGINNFTVNKSKYSYKIGVQTGASKDEVFNNIKNRFMLLKGTEIKDFELYGASPSLDYPSEVEAVGDNGNVKIVKSNKNFLSFEYKTGNGITFDKNRITIIDPTGYLYAGKTLVGGISFLSGKKVIFTTISNGTISGTLNFTVHTNKVQYKFQKKYTTGKYNNDIKSEGFMFANDEYITSMFVYTTGATSNLTIDVQVSIADEDFIEHQGNAYSLPIQKPFYKIGDYADAFIKQNNKWYEKHYIKELSLTGDDSETWTAKITDTFSKYQWSRALSDKLNILNSQIFCTHFKQITVAQSDALNIEGIANGLYPDYSLMIVTDKIKSLADFKTKLKELYESGNPIKIYYILKTPELIECTSEQTQILEQLSNLYLYEGINYLYSTDDLSPIFQFSYDKIVNDFKLYLSENGRLIFPNENISFLCSISESSIPSMPEALETSATIAGRDGDVPLSTTYGPMSFELVLYTEDNLTPEEKLKQEIFLNRFCNLIKNNTETFALELAQKFYKIKYNGLLNKENYPKFLKFTLPFKSSKSFAYGVKKHIIYGNSTVESNTIEPTGFECVIKGPAIKPIISLNDYSIEYNNTILDDESLIIDTNNSTTVLVNSEGTRVNAMRYYNHQFPKILNGENELKILSGIDNPENVSISWYDLTL